MHDSSEGAHGNHMNNAMEMGGHGGGAPPGHMDHHAHMVEDFKKIFWVSLIITFPILILSPLIQQFIGLGNKIRFTGDTYLLFALSTVIFFYGGRPFLKGLMDELLKYAASVESRSEHPIAQAIATSSQSPPPVDEFKAIPGKGAQGVVEKKEVMVVSPGYLRERNISVSKSSELDTLSSQGKTIVFVMIGGSVKGAIALADIIRPESKEAISRLKAMGIRCMMLTGDNKLVAQWVSQEIGLDEYFAEVLPKDKAAKIREVKERGLVTAMTGGGVNDAPALAQADVGIAIGAGTESPSR